MPTHAEGCYIEAAAPKARTLLLMGSPTQGPEARCGANRSPCPMSYPLPAAQPAGARHADQSVAAEFSDGDNNTMLVFSTTAGVLSAVACSHPPAGELGVAGAGAFPAPMPYGATYLFNAVPPTSTSRNSSGSSSASGCPGRGHGQSPEPAGDTPLGAQRPAAYFYPGREASMASTCSTAVLLPDAGHVGTSAGGRDRTAGWLLLSFTYPGVCGAGNCAAVPAGAARGWRGQGA